MLSASFSIGLYQKPTSSADLSTRFSCTCDLFSRRALKCEGKTDRHKVLVLRENDDHAVRWSARELKVQAQVLPSISNDQHEQKLSKYRFWTENGGQVTVAVGQKGVRYPVYIEFFPAHLNDNQKKVILSWGIYRNDSTSFIPLEFQSSTPNGQNGFSDIPVLRNSLGNYVVEMEFESYLAPFYLSFLLKHETGNNSENQVIKSHRNANFCIPVGLSSGDPAPLGLSFSSDGRINFALFAGKVERVSLCLFDDNASEKPALEIELDPYVNTTGDIWHASIDSVGPFVSYGYRCKRSTFDETTEKVLLDPYAKLLRKKVPSLPDLGVLCIPPGFDWSGDVHPVIPLEKLSVYRLNVKKFTEDKSCKLSSEISGTFSGVAEKVEHIKSLGFNAILLEPIFPYNEKQGPYFPNHFFSPEQAYGPAGDPLSAMNSMKDMVKRMHASGIEVLLEVVFSHTAEDSVLREVDPSYFYDDLDANLGDQNALNCNYPIVHQMILESLRYWVTEFQIDGFCFVNASYLLRGFHGEKLSRPPLIETITYDPVLSKTKMIADCWDPYDLTSNETRFPHWKKWCEINSKFSCHVRKFLRGEGLLSDLATRLCGSGDIFSAGRSPSFSLNFITRNSGLTLIDLVSFSDRSDLATELSWNCGEEGATDDKLVLERRLKQIRNFLFILFVSLGIPVLNMGDECGLSAGGSPAYSDKRPLNWSAMNTTFGIQTTRFITYLNALRERRSDLLQKVEFLKEEHIGWFHSDLSSAKWDDPAVKFLAMELTPDINSIDKSLDSSFTKGKFYVGFNAGEDSETIVLPPLDDEMVWVRLVDTGLKYPGFFSEDGVSFPEQIPELVTYEMKSHSCVLFEAKVHHG